MEIDSPISPSAADLRGTSDGSTCTLSLDRRLTDAEVDYVFEALERHVRMSRPLREVVVYTDAEVSGGHVVVRPSEGGIDYGAFLGEGGSSGGVGKGRVPLLFPFGGRIVSPYEFRDGNMYFGFDVVKAAFYLLSGYQEYASAERDQWGRFPYELSVQKRLDCTTFPVVNQYFKWIVDSIVLLSVARGFEASEVNPVGRTSVFLTHDVDLAHYHTWRKTLYRWAQVLGLRPCDTSRRRLLGAAWRSLLTMVGLRRDADTYWSFQRIMDNEAYMGLRSAYFFLPDDGSPFPPDYDVEGDSDIREVIGRIVGRGDSVGLHAPIGCQTAEAYVGCMGRVGGSVGWCRQHFLAVDQVRSLRAMAEAGITVDCSLGFSEHEGFRNSYCHPFRPFDHEAQRPLPIVEVPLAVMDVTLLRNRRLPIDECFLAVGDVLEKVRSFGGVFCLLWHNTTFDETYFPGVGQFYEDLMLMLSQYQLRVLDEGCLRRFA